MEKQFIKLCKPGKLEEAKKFLEENPTINISANNEYAFRMACFYGHLDVAKWLLEVKPDSANNEEAFRYACFYGHLDVAKWLLDVKPTIDISAENDQAFRRVCKNGNLEVAKWLLKIKPNVDISAKDDYAFRGACQNGHLEVAKWLLEVEPDIYPFIDMYISGQAGNDDTESDAFITEQKRFEVAEWIVSLNPEKYYLEREDNIDGNYQISKKTEYMSEKCPCCKQYIK